MAYKQLVVHHRNRITSSIWIFDQQCSAHTASFGGTARLCYRKMLCSCCNSNFAVYQTLHTCKSFVKQAPSSINTIHQEVDPEDNYVVYSIIHLWKSIYPCILSLSQKGQCHDITLTIVPFRNRKLLNKYLAFLNAITFIAFHTTLGPECWREGDNNNTEVWTN